MDEIIGRSATCMMCGYTMPRTGIGNKKESFTCVDCRLHYEVKVF